MTVKLKIPATSANLGSGFDSVGVGVSLYNELELAESDQLEIISMDDIIIPTDETNLVYESIKHIYDLCGKPLSGVSIKQWNRIPLSRGLGSSSACIVGGLVGGNTLLGNPLSEAELLNLATKIEGHPDNVAPALLGGMVSSVFTGEKVYYVKESIPNDLRFVVIIPDTELKTSVARNALPEEIPFSDAVFNLSRVGLMVLSIKNRAYGNLKIAAEDRLHQPYRFPFIKHSEAIIEKCYDLGAYAAMISGAGSTLMAIVPKAEIAFVDQAQSYLSELGLDGWKVASYLPENNGITII